MKLIFKSTLILLLTVVFLPLSAIAPQDRLEFWKTQKKGANGNMSKFRPEWFQAAADAGLQFIRFNVTFLPADDRDFLIGNADNFKKINRTDLRLLKKVLNEAEKHELKIIVAMFSLPGCRTSRYNGDKSDYRLWKEEKYQIQAIKFWQQLAKEIKNHPAVVGYDLLNEPHPELLYEHEEANQNFIEWFKKIKDSPADINRFNRRMVSAIRKVDKYTPIFLEGYFYADPKSMPFMEPVDDDAVFYTFHNPAPWQFAAYRANKKRYSYPDKMPEEWNGPGKKWTIDNLSTLLDPVRDFIKKNKIPAYKIVASELWCDRRVKGCKEYLADAIKLYNDNNWHWAFYAFREDGDWGGLDYELGSKPFNWVYWDAVEKGKDPELLKKRGNNPIWNVIKSELQ